MSTTALDPNSNRASTLLSSVNVVLANLGESPINTLAGDVLPQQVSLALNTIKEVSDDIQSKGWWFNQLNADGNYSTIDNIVIYPSRDGVDFHASIPEEAIRYITIRAARIAQTRLIGSEELQKFSFNEELVSLAILQQAHVRNSNGVLDFNDFPAELKGLGVDEVMFLQGNVEEKLGMLRLGGELASTAKTKAETDLIAAQELKVDEETDLLQQQFLTEVEETVKRQEEIDLLQSQDTLVIQQELTETEETLKRTAETANVQEQTKLITSQELKTDEETKLITAQELKVDAESELIKDQEAKTVSEKNLIDAQKTQLVAETAVGAQAESTFFTGVEEGSQSTYFDFSAELRMMGIQESDFQNTPAYKKVELIKDATKLRAARATDGSTDQTEKDEVNKILRLIGESQVSSVNSNAMSSDCVRLLRDTSKELQGRGWWFNTEYDVDLYSGSNLESAEVKFNYSSSQDFELLPNYDSGSSVYLVNTLEVVDGGQGKAGTWRGINTTGYNITKTTANPPSGQGVNTSNKYRWKINDGGDQSYGLFSTINSTDDKSASATETDLDYPWNATWDSSKVNVTQAKMIDLPETMLSVETNDYDTTTRTFKRDVTEYGTGKIRMVKYLYNLKTKSFNFINTPVKAKIIYERKLEDLPQKFLEYLEVRVAILLTELYPQSGIDIQRLPKMEQELRAYFKDRENDEGNYTVFDNYDAATRIGINRNYSL